ncbi:vacuolar protein sorting-associated protein 13D-like isoform X2 [Centruroides sculpturatus]|uniref:vacuolar protein sorting-associated protein 13D-like isoform X2 n=1 Tax=Centruroides sculpturatus TaxID=218467 RepID=UPI000C6DA63E|nr:vacuolar protein sorting-associated protein 13D-like isoform X2 [Centruroides sculpturatus]
MTDNPQSTVSYSSQRSFVSSGQLSHQPGHKIFLLPPLKITNLLPYELHFVVKDNESCISGYIKPGHNTSLHNVDVSEIMIFEFSCENFQKCNELIVRPCSREFLTRILMYDNQDRLLMLQARVIPLYGGALKINISSPYWLINNSGLPLVFRQEGTQVEAAGQSDEHELARSVVPLLFSFADKDASAMCSIRIGRSLHPNSLTQWCNSFNLQKGIRVRHLHVTPRDSRPDWVYTIGIDVRMGRGRYRDTYMVTVSPRYQLDNKSSYKLEFSQKFAVENLKKFSHQYVMSAVPNCHMPFHWPRVDLDNLLCVRLSDVPDCMWSGGFSIDKINSFHVNMRNGHGKSHFLRVEIILQGAKYIIVFSDAENMPSPLRIDNHSEVPIIYYQTNIIDERLKTSVRPGSCVPYAWDEPTLPPMITCCAPGGATATYNMNVFGEGDKLFYGNFIYLSFTGTFSSLEKQDPLQTKSFKKMMCQDLVLDVPEGTTKVILSRKEQGKRSQLWRMGSTGLLHHEGSSPPQDPRRKVSQKDLERTLVLDIAGLSPLPGIFVPLMLRKPDERRSLTQTWHFTEDGRLCCDHPNLFVQPKDGFSGLKAGQEAVLGPNQPVIYMTTPNDIPLEQAIVPQKLRGGSGVLAVKVIPDGPTRVLQIYDFRQKLVSMTNSSTDWVVVEEQKKLKTKLAVAKNSLHKQTFSKIEETYAVHIYSHLSGGFGISLINHLSEELIYICLQNIMVEYNRTHDGHSVDGSIQNIQVDNQLRDAEKPTLLFVTPPSKKDQQRHLPAIHFTANKVFTTHINAEIFKHLIITIKNLTVQAEEKLLFKLLLFAGFNQSDAELEKMDENDTLPQRALMSSTCTRRYYFNTLKLSLPQVKLSVLTSGSLPSELSHIKKKMGWKLIRFEDAMIELDPFVRVHPFETAQFLVDSIIEHYKEELKSQAAKILGAVDFLGNPLGLLYDVSDGVNDLLNEGDVRGLIKNVAHGLSDSAAKMTGSLSDSLGLVAMDNHHQEIRKKIKYDVNAGSDHLVAGLKGFGYGLFGGVTSLITQTYEGASTEGVQGFFSGLGKGLVGTVAKPAAGFLDLATGAASAVRDTSRRNSHAQPERCRLPRVCFGPGGLLPPYNADQARGQQIFFAVSSNHHERFVSYHCLRRAEGMELLLTDAHIIIVNRSSTSTDQILLVSLENLLECAYVQPTVGEIRHYVQLTLKAGTPSLADQPGKRPQFRCDTQTLAYTVVEEINYVKELHEERFYTLPEDEIEELDD